MSSKFNIAKVTQFVWAPCGFQRHSFVRANGNVKF